jgi:hypothetical protein
MNGLSFPKLAVVGKSLALLFAAISALACISSANVCFGGFTKIDFRLPLVTGGGLFSDSEPLMSSDVVGMLEVAVEGGTKGGECA